MTQNREQVATAPSDATAGVLRPVRSATDRPRGYAGTPPLPKQPALSAPEEDPGTIAPPPRRSQPLTGLAGLTFLVPLFYVLAFADGGAVRSLQVLAPLTTYALPVVAMMAFYWEDWPGSKLRAGWSGLADTLLIMASGVGFTLLGQAVIGGFDARALFDPDPGIGHVATFPATMPVAAGAFTAILQLTMVTEGWPFRALGRLSSGLAALVVAWGIAVGGYLLLVGFVPPSTGGLRDPGGPVAPGAYGAWLTALGAWQLLFYMALRGWPFKTIRHRAIRLPLANVVVIACTWGCYLIMRQLFHWPTERVSAVCGCAIAAILIVAMLFEAWPWIVLKPLPGRTGVVITSVVVAGLLYWALLSYARTLDWGRSHPEDWVAYSALNAIGLGVILHVAIWNRWPVVVGAGEERAKGGEATDATSPAIKNPHDGGGTT